MKINIISDNFSREKFNQAAFHPLQSWEWGETRKELGVEIIRIGEFKQKTLINVFTISLHKLPIINNKIGYLPRSAIPSKATLAFIKNLCLRIKVPLVKIEPYVEKNNKVKMDFSSIKVSPHPLFPTWTQILDLTQKETTLLEKMHPKTRYNIRLAQRKGVKIQEETNEKGFGIFSNLYFETCKRQKYFGHNLKYHQAVFRNLKDKIAHIFVSYYQKEPLAAYQIWFFKERAYYVYGGSSEKYRQYMASNLLMWEVIRWAKNQGAKYFDLWGSLPPDYPKNHPWAGFTRFKQGYAGKFVELIGSYDLVLNPLTYHFFSVGYSLRKVFLKFRYLLSSAVV